MTATLTPAAPIVRNPDLDELMVEPVAALAHITHRLATSQPITPGDPLTVVAVGPLPALGYDTATTWLVTDYESNDLGAPVGPTLTITGHRLPLVPGEATRLRVTEVVGPIAPLAKGDDGWLTSCVDVFDDAGSLKAIWWERIGFPVDEWNERDITPATVFDPAAWTPGALVVRVEVEA